MDSEANYSNEALQDFFDGTDSKIDDEGLLNKKALIAKQNPLSLINQLSAKWKPYGSQINLLDCYETRDPKTLRSVWHVRISLTEKRISVEAQHQQKATARFLASQLFLKAILPEGTTWNDTLKMFGDKNSVDILNRVLP